MTMTWMRLFKTYLPTGKTQQLQAQLAKNHHFLWREQIANTRKKLESNIIDVSITDGHLEGKFDYDYIETIETRKHPEGKEILAFGTGSFVLNERGVLLYFGSEKGSKKLASHLRHTTTLSLKAIPISGQFLKKLRKSQAIDGVKKICYTGINEDYIEEHTIKGEHVERSIKNKHLHETASEVRKLTVVLSTSKTIVTMSFYETGSVCIYGYNGDTARNYALAAIEKLTPILPKIEPPLKTFTSPTISSLPRKTVKEKQ